MNQRKGAYAPEFRQQMVELVRAGRKPSLRQVTQQRDILAKATAWFADKDSGIDKTSMR